jgi:hypothetical protein
MMFNRGTATLHAVSTELGSVEIDVIIPSKSYREQTERRQQPENLKA